MQVKKSYTATVDAGTNINRTYSYGMTNTTSTSDTRTDYFNQVIADFLSECGVDAAYEARGESADKYLWIRGVPFLFEYNYNSSVKKYGHYLYFPYCTTAVWSGCAFIYNGSSGDVSFSLLFTGNPRTGFCLRWVPYGTTNVDYGSQMVFYKAKNMINGRDATVWRLGTGTSSYSYVYPFYAVDIQDGIFDKDTYTVQGHLADVALLLPNIQYEQDPKKILLVPVTVANWQLEGVYKTPAGYFPLPVNGYTEEQTEVEMGGRRFIVTSYITLPSVNANSPNNYYGINLSSSYLNLGLIEVTDA